MKRKHIKNIQGVAQIFYWQSGISTDLLIVKAMKEGIKLLIVCLQR